jgi:hypothetical protein
MKRSNPRLQRGREATQIDECISDGRMKDRMPSSFSKLSLSPEQQKTKRNEETRRHAETMIRSEKSEAEKECEQCYRFN